jgi:hypothetical protein
MNKLALIVFLVIGTHAFAQSKAGIAKSPTEFIPAGYVVFDKIEGDLNRDGRADYVFVIKGTDKSMFVKDEYRGELDRNSRGIIIVFSNQNGYELALENRNCFSSENEDGGVYFAPELDVYIAGNGIVRVHYAHGRYGYWTYSFRYQNSDFELIGYDRSEDRGPVVERSTSINLLTKKMRIRQNVNVNAETDGDEKFRESWEKFTLSKPIKLSEIADFDNFRVEDFIKLRE